MSPVHGEAVVQHSRTQGSPDTLGNVTWTDTDKDRTAVLYPTPSTELVQGQDTNLIRLSAVFMPAIIVAATDEFTARGERWTVDAFPWQYDTPFSYRTLTLVHLTRMEG